MDIILLRLRTEFLEANIVTSKIQAVRTLELTGEVWIIKGPFVYFNPRIHTSPATGTFAEPGFLKSQSSLPEIRSVDAIG